MVMLCMVWSECCFECVPFGEAVSSARRDALFVLTIVKQTNPARVQLHTHHIHTHTQIYIYINTQLYPSYIEKYIPMLT